MPPDPAGYQTVGMLSRLFLCCLELLEAIHHHLILTRPASQQQRRAKCRIHHIDELRCGISVRD
jgi:hypothetical protein